MYSKHRQNGKIINPNTQSFSQQIPNKMEHNRLIKIVGIHFKKDIEMTKRYNIRKCIQKMENNVKIQNQRHLFLKGKTIIINTLLLSKL